MSSPPKQPAPPTCEEAQATLARVVGGFFSYDPSTHGRTRGRQRNFDDQDVREVLTAGNVVAVRRHEVTGEFLFVVQGLDLDGDPLTIVVEVLETYSMVRLVTGY
jgi:hypothetical protein